MNRGTVMASVLVKTARTWTWHKIIVLFATNFAASSNDPAVITCMYAVAKTTGIHLMTMSRDWGLQKSIGAYTRGTFGQCHTHLNYHRMHRSTSPIRRYDLNHNAASQPLTANVSELSTIHCIPTVHRQRIRDIAISHTVSSNGEQP